MKYGWLLYTFQVANNKGPDQTAQAGLVCIFVVRMQQNQVFLRRGPYENSTFTRFICKHITAYALKSN